ncbi:TonB-dependent receptor [Sandaracinobacter sp. RS1-74]|uniref:TonB-dependent receptor plug domain-containing protein n=1 Tax=Sandaracinobacteroides sayramensis TaxID=2913411 RepID=UPI001EDAC1F7|nr:TonB-dependent receptor [Sandaracinobacteroides sayramensis]MCG2840256.1 TonB-dependent receptor [Sandaracinobacteroides sayramensis]
MSDHPTNPSAGHRALLRAGISTLVLLAGGAALAQEAAPLDDPEAIIVTGSRIARLQIDTQVPIAVVDSTAIRQDGSANMQDILRKMPQIGIGTSRSNSNFNDTGNGAASVNLRNLGPSRTLVLVNGRRFVAGFPGTSAVDINNIPTDFVERVEIVTGGASAVYGSDAIAGVVNFILKDDFEGVSARAEYGLTARGDNPRYLLSLTGGTSWGPDDRGHVSLNFTYDNDEGLLSRDRKNSREDRSLAIAGVPAYSSYAPQGRFDLRTANSSAQVFTFDTDNSLVFGFPQRLAYNRNWDRRISLPVERYLVTGNIKYDVADNLEFFFEPTFSKVKSSALLEAYSFDWSFVYKDGALGMPITNAYIPAPIRTIIDTRNSDADPANDIVAIQYRRRQNEVYNRSNEAERDTWRVATGFSGDLGSRWSYELSYVYGHMSDYTGTQDIDAIRYRQALDSIVDANGQIVCRDPAARAQGCVAINLFGFGTVTPEGADYVVVPRWAKIRNTQHVLNANVTGSLLTLPAGDLGVAFGGEYRKEKSVTDWDDNTNAGNGTGSQRDDLSGQFEVYELFGEANVPLLAERPFAHYLGLTGAVRYSDYSTVGGVFSWNVGAEYAPMRGLRLRANYAVANRAPNVAELYASVTGGASGATVLDPCAGTTLTSTRPQDATCRAIPGLVDEIVANGGTFTYSSFDINWMGVSEGGNPDLKEETAKTFTAGGVLTPAALPGFSLSVDYFNIKIDDAIGSLPAQITVDRCIELGDPFYCSSVERFPTGKLYTIDTRLVNVASIKTSGIDVNLNYSTRLGLAADDNLAFNLFYTYLLELEKRSYTGGPLENNRGQLYAGGRLGTGFKHKADARLTYGIGGFSASWQVNYLSAIQDRLDWEAPAGPDQAYLQSLNDVGAVWYHNAQLSYTVPGKTEFEFVLGVDNIFDREAPLIPSGFASSVTGVESAQEYDPYGRRYYIGARVRF